MLRYVLRRLLLAIPTLWLISLAIFGLSRLQPTDPVLRACGSQFTARDPLERSREYLGCAQQLNQQGPAFYFSWTASAYPDTLHRIYPLDRRMRLKQRCSQTGNWPAVQAFDQAAIEAYRWVLAIPDSIRSKSLIDQAALRLLGMVDMTEADSAFHKFKVEADQLSQSGLLKTSQDAHSLAARAPAVLVQLEQATKALKIHNKTALYLPAFYWHGTDNQYHRWITRFIKGDFGYSYIWGKPVSDVLSRPLRYTLLINFFALGLAYLLAVPLGIALARKQSQALDRWGNGILLFFYTIPVFVLGSLLMYLLATPHSGFSLFKGVSFDDCGTDTSVLFCLLKNAPQATLPVLTISVHFLAFFALQMRGSILDVSGQEYIRTARAKGLSEEEVYWTHARRNAIFPLITSLAYIFPSMFAGSIVVEYLFNYPGMGGKLQSAMSNQDYPVLFTILMFASIITVLAQLMADLLYKKLDPRVQFDQRSA